MRRIWYCAAVIVVLATAPIVLFSVLMPNDYLRLYVGSLVGVLLVVVFSFSIRSPFDAAPDTGSLSLDQVAHAFRMQGLMVKQEPAKVAVQIDRWVALVLTRSAARSDRFEWRLDGTPATLSLTLLILFFGPLSLINVPLDIYLLYWAERYATDYGTKVVEGRADIAAAKGDPVRESLIDGLSESRRVATEAYHSARSAYDDSMALVMLGAVIGWLVSFAFLALSNVFDPSYRVLAALVISFAVFVAAPLLVRNLVARRVKPQVEKLGEWSQKLEEGLMAEILGQEMENGASSIELLFDAHDQLPIWLKARQKENSYRYPAASFLMIWLVLFSASFVAGAVGEILSGGLGLDAAVLFTIGAILLGGAILINRVMKHLEEVEDQALMRDFEQRKSELSRMIEREFGRA